MILLKSFEPDQIEGRWYKIWEERGYFAAGDDINKSKAFCILLPPPNVTGTLHMGHGFNQTLMDILVRYHRMRGANVLWQPGTDHAGIATQLVVERQLEREGIYRANLTREEFLSKVLEWKHYSGQAITQQMRRLGVSCDWSRECFTMDECVSKAVIETFVSLYNEGLIYRGKRLVNWDTQLRTAISDLEVLWGEEDGFLYYICYPLTDRSKSVIVATTRPETIFGDVALMVHPNDSRYLNLIGKFVASPLTDQKIPIIADDYVNPEFGSGCVKVTPAHDFNDYHVGQRHNLPIIPILTLDGKLNCHAPKKYQGLDRFESRKAILEDLKSKGLLEKVDQYKFKVPRSDRTGVVIEPMLTDQWFIDMNKPSSDGNSIAEKALKVVANGEINFYPKHWIKTYNQWLNNIQDWCISRQISWGHQIPAWYSETGKVYVACDEASAKILALKSGETGPLRRDQDVLDTWYSSALWPFSALGWSPDWPKVRNPILDRYLPTSVLVTGFDIIFFWVARMVIMTKHVTGKIPFKHVYVHGLIRDSKSQKMSKSKGNVLDPIDLIDGITLERLIAKRTFGLINPKQSEEIERTTRLEFPNGIPSFGADALRFTFASLASPGRDIKFDLSRCQGYRSFCNKLWNATRFVLINVHNVQQGKTYGDQAIDIAAHYSDSDRWILSLLQRAIKEITEQLSEYRFDTAAQTLYHLIWNEYCDWYLEIAKIRIKYGTTKQRSTTCLTLLNVLETILRLAHPFIPFITEELWQKLAPLAGCKTHETILLTNYPRANKLYVNKTAESKIEQLKTLVSTFRNLHSSSRQPLSGSVTALIVATQKKALALSDETVFLLQHLTKLSTVKFVNQIPSDIPFDQTLSVTVLGNIQLALIMEADVLVEMRRLEKEAAKLDVKIKRATDQLENISFINRAPQHVVESVRQSNKFLREELTRIYQKIDQLKNKA